MMKRKRILSFAMAICIVAMSGFMSAQAAEEAPASPGQIILEPVTDEEIVTLIAENNHISYQEAQEQYHTYQMISAEKNAPRVIEKVNVSYVEDFGTSAHPCKVKIGAIAEMNMVAGYRELVSIVPGTEYAQCISSGLFTYEPGNCYVGLYSPKEIHYMTSGNLVATISTSASDSLTADLEVIGFSLEVTVGTTEYWVMPISIYVFQKLY